MEQTVFDTLFARYPALLPCREDIFKADLLIKACYDRGGKLLICGNGGSCADAQHMVGELMKGFLKKRPLNASVKDAMRRQAAVPEALLQSLQVGLPALSLCEAGALSTAFANDVDPLFVYAQQVYSLAGPNDLLVGLSTSGNAENVINAVYTARAIGIDTLCLTGRGGGLLKSLCAAAITVPATETYQVQELHLPVYHALCASVESYYFTE